jgi:hypothetical protein
MGRGKNHTRNAAYFAFAAGKDDLAWVALFVSADGDLIRRELKPENEAGEGAIKTIRPTLPSTITLRVRFISGSQSHMEDPWDLLGYLNNVTERINKTRATETKAPRHFSTKSQTDKEEGRTERDFFLASMIGPNRQTLARESLIGFQPLSKSRMLDPSIWLIRTSWFS